MEEHERICYRNPARRTCQTCANRKETTETVYNPYHGGDPGSTDYERSVRYCEADIDISENMKHDCEMLQEVSK